MAKTTCGGTAALCGGNTPQMTQVIEIICGGSCGGSCGGTAAVNRNPLKMLAAVLRRYCGGNPSPLRGSFRGSPAGGLLWSAAS